MLGNVIFTWTPSNHSFYDVLITTDTTSGDWKKNPSAQYTVKDALQYDSISINVRAPPSFESNIMTYYGTFFYFLFDAFVTMSPKQIVCLQSILCSLEIDKLK